MSAPSRASKIARTCVALAIVPAAWPLGFIASTKIPGVVDPLLGGLQDVLYAPALAWILLTLLVATAVAKLPRLRRTRTLFGVVSVVSGLALSAGFAAYEAWGDCRLIGRPDIVAPSRFDVAYELTRSMHMTSLMGMVCFLTAALFVLAGGLSAWLPDRSAPAQT